MMKEAPLKEDYVTRTAASPGTDNLLLREKAFDPARVSDLSYDQWKGAIIVFSFAKKPDKVMKSLL